MARLLGGFAVLCVASGFEGLHLQPDDSLALVQAHLQRGDPIPPDVQAASLKDAKDTLKTEVKSETAYGLASSTDTETVKRCSDITSSLHCSMSQKVYGFPCAGWGGSSCLEPNAQCLTITNEQVCKQALSKLNMTCLGWGGSRCLPLGAKAKLITAEHLCTNSEVNLGIRSLGWSGNQCLDKETASCDKITRSGICNDALLKLGLDCAGWGGSRCLPKNKVTCKDITSKNICDKAFKRGFGISCKWNVGLCNTLPGHS